jgi:ATP-dependent Clp protease adaptor protein ClpS
MPSDLLTQTRPEVETEQLQRLRDKLFPPYRVILFNDDYNDMDYVVLVLLHTINNLSRQEATRIMLTAHLKGSAIVVVCPNASPFVEITLQNPTARAVDAVCSPTAKSGRSSSRLLAGSAAMARSALAEVTMTASYRAPGSS